MKTFSNTTVPTALFIAPFFLEFPAQFLNCILVTGGAGFFDPPGFGWVVLYCGIKGFLIGGICLAIYSCLRSALNQKTISIVYLLLAAGLWIPLDRFNADEDERNSFILDLAYVLFYTGAKESTLVDQPLPPGYPACIPPLTRIQVDDPRAGNFEITTGRGLLRTYSWAGASRSISMVPVTHDSNRELNYPMDLQNRTHGFPGFNWKMHDHVARFCSYESVISFQSTDAAVDWIRNDCCACVPNIYTSDGLVITWSKHIEPGTLWVLVRQVLIKGEKPKHLPGASDLTIRITKVKTT